MNNRQYKKYLTKLDNIRCGNFKIAKFSKEENKINRKECKKEWRRIACMMKLELWIMASINAEKDLQAAEDDAIFQALGMSI